MTNIFPIDFEEKNDIAQNDFILFSDSEDGNKLKKAQYKNLKGEPGNPGTPGADGTSATITVGSTTTGAAGTSASVTNTGTSSAAVLNFVIPQGLKGEDGTDGTDGQDGAAATITVGTTSTLPAGSSATVTNSGTSSAAVFNFGIPQGTTGATGNGIASITSSKVGKITTVTITETNTNVDTFQISDGADGTGSGDVIGPASSTDGDVAIFDGVSGKLIKDGSVALSTLSAGASAGATAVQPGDNVSDLVNDAGYLTSAPVSSVNSQTGAVTLDADDISDSTTTNKFVTATDKSTWSGKQDALTLPATPTQGHLVTRGADNESLTDGGAIPTGVPAVGTDGQVLTVVSGVATWASPTGGIQEAPNSPITGIKYVWRGSEAQYAALSQYYTDVPGDTEFRTYY